MKKNYYKTNNLLLDFEKNLKENVDLIDVYEPLSKKLLKKIQYFMKILRYKLYTRFKK